MTTSNVAVLRVSLVLVPADTMVTSTMYQQNNRQIESRKSACACILLLAIPSAIHNNSGALMV